MTKEVLDSDYISLKADFDEFRQQREDMGEWPKTITKQLKEFLSIIKNWQLAHKTEAIARLHFEFVYGVPMKLLTDSEKIRKIAAMRNTRSRLANIRRNSNSVIPASIKRRDKDTGRSEYRPVNISNKSDLNRRLGMSDMIKDGIARQDEHIQEVIASGERARREAMARERQRSKRRRH